MEKTMVTGKQFITGLLFMVCIALACALPVAAINVAVYGDTAGFDASLHPDTFTLVYSLPGTAGSDLDARVAQYTNASTDVIFIGGDGAFSSGTASQIEEAVSSGKILVVTEQNFQNFATSIPLQATGTVPESLYLKVESPNSTISQDIFAGLDSRFPNMTPVSSRERYASKPASVTLLRYDNDDPALIYTKYGNGFIVAWTPSSTGEYLTGTEADTINERLITHLLALRTAASPAQTTVSATFVPVNVTTTTVAIPSSPVQHASGSASVYSSPLGATVFIDGEYRGITPLNLTAMAPGSHAMKMALDGYYDYDSTIYIISGGTITAFGTLPPREATAVILTVAPTSAVTAVATQASIFENPSVIAAVLGIMTAIIGAVATIYTIHHKNKGGGN